jgi:excisionase family DNA binding protein
LPPEFLDVRQTAEYLTKSEVWVRNHVVRNRLIPYHRIGKSIRFLRADVDAYIASRRVTAERRPA